MNAPLGQRVPAARRILHGRRQPRPRRAVRDNGPMQTEYAYRSARPDDYDGIVAVVDGWWGRPIAGALQRLFLDHFWRTSLIAEGPTGADGRPALAGFPSA